MQSLGIAPIVAQGLGTTPMAGARIILRLMTWLVQSLGITTMAGVRLGYRANGWRYANIALDGWCKAWVLRQWLARGLFFAPDGGTVLAKGLKAELERVMEHHLRTTQYKGVKKQKIVSFRFTTVSKSIDFLPSGGNYPHEVGNYPLIFFVPDLCRVVCVSE
jgi:hypothetical protein